MLIAKEILVPVIYSNLFFPVTLSILSVFSIQPPSDEIIFTNRGALCLIQAKHIPQLVHLFLPSLSASATFPYRHYKETAAPAKELTRGREGGEKDFRGEKKRERGRRMTRKQWRYLELAVHGRIDKQSP